MGELYDRMLEDLKIGCYSPCTTKIYLLYARQFARFHMRSPAEMGVEEIRESQLSRPAAPRKHATIASKHGDASLVGAEKVLVLRHEDRTAGRRRTTVPRLSLLR